MEIDQWIKNNDYKGEYIIIDDVPDFTKEQMKRYIKTDPKVGLTINDIDKYLNENISI